MERSKYRWSATEIQELFLKPRSVKVNIKERIIIKIQGKYIPEIRIEIIYEYTCRIKRQYSICVDII